MAMVEQFSLGLDLAHRISGPVFDGRGGVQEMFDDSAYSAAPAQLVPGRSRLEIARRWSRRRWHCSK